jgi:hypothetical protein
MQFITAHVQIDVEYDPYRGPTGLPEALSSEILFDVLRSSFNLMTRFQEYPFIPC